MIRETLRGGDQRLSGKLGAFLYTRLRPGTLLTLSCGRDTGEFGTSPLDIVEREFHLFNRPVHWFFDATRVENATAAVSEQWTTWLRANRGKLAQMHVLAATEETHLMIGIARHFSNSSNLLKLYSDRTAWTTALLRSAPGLVSVPDLYGRLDEPAIAVSRNESVDRSVVLETSDCTWSFRPLTNGVIYTAFAGDDSGDLTNAAFDAMDSLIQSSLRKSHWFLNLRDARNVSAPVSQTWTEWLGARQDRFARVTAYSPAPLFPLVLTVAKYRSGTDHLFDIYRDSQPFRADLIKATSGELAASVGMA
ncbi:MAG TPA: hypothetical protein VEX68_17765 [Bryobacteraceae bacterium]|nr:hypothetical protein [Bryobacteraceae bacterium]